MTAWFVSIDRACPAATGGPAMFSHVFLAVPRFLNPLVIQSQRFLATILNSQARRKLLCSSRKAIKSERPSLTTQWHGFVTLSSSCSASAKGEQLYAEGNVCW